MAAIGSSNEVFFCRVKMFFLIEAHAYFEALDCLSAFLFPLCSPCLIFSDLTLPLIFAICPYANQDNDGDDSKENRLQHWHWTS